MDGGGGKGGGGEGGGGDGGGGRRRGEEGGGAAGRAMVERAVTGAVEVMVASRAADMRAVEAKVRAAGVGARATVAVVGGGWARRVRAHREGLVLDQAALRHVAVVLLRGHVAAARGSRGSDLCSPHTPCAEHGAGAGRAALRRPCRRARRHGRTRHRCDGECASRRAPAAPLEVRCSP